MLKQLREHAPAYGPSVQNASGSPIEKYRAVALDGDLFEAELRLSGGVLP